MTTVITASSSFTAPPLHPMAESAVEAFSLLACMGDLDPLPDLPTSLAPSIEHVSINAWLTARHMWHESHVRGDIRLAIQSAELINLAYTRGDEPHPLVEMLGTSDPIDTTGLQALFNCERPRILARVVWWCLGSLGTLLLTVIGVAADMLTRV